jgi:hypothetical protein
MGLNHLGVNHRVVHVLRICATDVNDGVHTSKNRQQACNGKNLLPSGFSRIR